MRQNRMAFADFSDTHLSFKAVLSQPMAQNAFVQYAADSSVRMPNVMALCGVV